MISTNKETHMQRVWKYFSSIAIFALLMLTLIIGSGEMLQGQLLRVGEQLFGNKDAGVQYSFLRVDPTKPDCNPNPDIDAQVAERMAASKADEFAALFGGPNPDDLRSSFQAAADYCGERFEMYNLISDNITPGVKVYRSFETALLYVTRLGVDWQQVLLMGILLISAITTTMGLHHIALRPPSSKRDFVVYNLAMVLANTLLLFSTATYLKGLLNTELDVDPSKLVFHGLWVSLFAGLLIISVVKLIKPPKVTETGSWGLAFLSIPLYATMGVIASLSFFFLMDYTAGVGIWLGQMEEFSAIFLKLALFIWIGMLLKQTDLVDYFMDLVRPFNFSPESLAVILMVVGSIMTAYTGASGVFVIAAGAIIYREVYSSGARRQYALAMTAMSGSLGVVLRPCLVIVVIAALNNKVTTDDLYSKGLLVFMISGSILLLFSLLLADKKFQLRKPTDALPESADALRMVAPYIIITFAVVLFFAKILDTSLNEFTAATILPFVLLIVLFYDKSVRGMSIKDSIESISPYLAVPILMGGIYSIFMKITGLESAFVWTIDLVLFDIGIDFVFILVALLSVAAYYWALSVYRERGVARATHSTSSVGSIGVESKKGFIPATGAATYETIGHIGALVMLMALSIVTGGLIERSELILSLPTEFSSTLIAIMLFTFVLVLIGMIMEPFGAAILVNATIAPVAYNNGINPIHFWMIVLTAFELGYLTPPVAINQLLARQVVGEEEMAEADKEVKDKSFYWKYERWILPFTIMLITLLIVAFIPYFLQMFGWY